MKAISCFPSKNQNQVLGYQRDRFFRNTCPISYCEGGEITNCCVPDRKCTNGWSLPYSSYLVGSRYELIDNLTDESQIVHVFNRMYHRNIACLPCCPFESNNPKMPGKIQMISIVIVKQIILKYTIHLFALALSQLMNGTVNSTVDAMCEWYAQNPLWSPCYDFHKWMNEREQHLEFYELN